MFDGERLFDGLVRFRPGGQGWGVDSEVAFEQGRYLVLVFGLSGEIEVGMHVQSELFCGEEDEEFQVGRVGGFNGVGKDGRPVASYGDHGVTTYEVNPQEGFGTAFRRAEHQVEGGGGQV